MTICSKSFKTFKFFGEAITLLGKYLCVHKDLSTLMFAIVPYIHAQIYTHKYINIHGEIECLLVEHNIQKYCAVNLNNSLEKEMVLGP